MKNNKKSKIIQGRWYKINKKIEKRITAKYHKIKDWIMDPKGYFLIMIDKEKKLLRVGYCKFRINNTTDFGTLLVHSEKVFLFNYLDLNYSMTEIVF